MKKLLILFLIFPSLCLAGSGMGPVGGVTFTQAGSSPYCTSSTSDGTNTYLLCEDFSGSTECATDYDSVCRQTFTANLGSGDTLDFTNAVPGTSPCSDSTNAPLITADNNSQTYVRGSFSATDQTTTQLYFLISAETLADGEIAKLSRASNSVGTSWQMVLKQTADDSTLRLKFNYHDGSSEVQIPATDTDAKQISTGTWYRVRVKWDNTSNVQQFVVSDANGDNTVTLDTTSAITRGVDRVYIMENQPAASRAVTAYWMNVRILSGTSYPNACTP